jgi:hypothetical protein
MVCEGLRDLDGCGGCTYDLCSRTLLTTLTSVSVVRLCLYIASGEQVSVAPIDISSSSMQCDGELTIAWSTKAKLRERKAVASNARVCAHILNLWCLYHPASSRSMLGLPIRRSINQISITKKKQELVRMLSTLSSHVSDMCNNSGACCSVVYGKVQQCCCFRFIDTYSLNYIQDFSLVLDTLHHNIKVYLRLGIEDHCLDLYDSGVGCDATLVLSKRLVQTNNPLGYIVTQCTAIIKAWYSVRSYSDLRVSLNEVLYRLGLVKNIQDVCTVLTTCSSYINKSM